MMPHLLGAWGRRCSEAVSQHKQMSNAGHVPAAAPAVAAQPDSGTLSGGPGLTEEYPADMRIRNTFLDFPTRPASLDEFLEQRQVRSAPGSGIDGLPPAAVPQAGPPVLHLAALLDNLGAASGAAAAPAPWPAAALPEVAPLGASTSTPASLSAATAAQASVLPGPPAPGQDWVRPVLGSPEMPTVGSELHALGQCRPCAFAWKEEGCDNGVRCQFCHLCEPGEKKKRQKEKKAFMRAFGLGSGGSGGGFRNDRQDMPQVLQPPEQQQGCVRQPYHLEVLSGLRQLLA
eukprot:TRINITY_DN74821_c0_g1_i1.p1 TRINITY_DN74821_c0_g1~~TRINITY_DN74821_c0_g1_i1.p1  ORF type:complete len:288 (-),score=54.29 TRINITY_DN74821_c0_g1_i1:190-1053(-)